MIAASLAAFAGNAFAQNTSSTSAHASAEIIYPIVLSATNATINFGNIIPPSSNDGSTGTVTVAMNSGISYQYSDMDPGSQRGTVGAASFSVTGEGGFNYTVSTPTVTSYSSSPSWGSMTLTFPTSPTATYPTSALTLSNTAPNQGSGTFNVGGMLTVPSSQTVGAYSATIALTVQYQ